MGFHYVAEEAGSGERVFEVHLVHIFEIAPFADEQGNAESFRVGDELPDGEFEDCLLYTSDAADE